MTHGFHLKGRYNNIYFVQEANSSLIESVGEICYSVIDGLGTFGPNRSICLTNTHKGRLTQHILPGR